MVFHFENRHPIAIEKRGLIETKFRFAIALYGESMKYCVVLGGRKRNEESFLSSCELYDIQNEIVTVLPSLNVGRGYLSACCVKNSVYAICGKSNEGYLSSIEKLSRPDDNDTASWDLLEIDESVLSPRSSTLAFALNDQELLISGGFYQEEISVGYWLTDAIVYNKKTLEARKVVE